MTTRTCTAAVFHGPGKPLDLQDIDVPEVEAGEALVRVDLCTLCGSDLHTITGARSEPVPTILGHEILGTVTDVGDPPPTDLSGSQLEPGDRITWSTGVACLECDRCRGGYPQKCRKLKKYGHEVAQGRYALSGGLAEYLLLQPGSSIVKLDSDLPDSIACPANCATATICAAYRVGAPIQGQRILILGSGMLGLTAAAWANAHEAADVTICDQREDRLTLARSFGADRCVRWTKAPNEFREQLAADSSCTTFDLILECSGSPDAVEIACDLGDIGARIVLVGTVLPSRPVQLDPEQIVRRWLSIRGIHNYTPQDLSTAVEFLKQFHHRYPFAELVQQQFTIADVADAVDYALVQRPIRVAVHPGKVTVS